MGRNLSPGGAGEGHREIVGLTYYFAHNLFLDRGQRVKRIHIHIVSGEEIAPAQRIEQMLRLRSRIVEAFTEGIIVFRHDERYIVKPVRERSGRFLGGKYVGQTRGILGADSAAAQLVKCFLHYFYCPRAVLFIAEYAQKRRDRCDSLPHQQNAIRPSGAVEGKTSETTLYKIRKAGEAHNVEQQARFREGRISQGAFPISPPAVRGL